MKFFKSYKFLDSSLIKISDSNSFRFIKVCVSLGVDFYELSINENEDKQEYIICVKNKDLPKLKESAIKTDIRFEIIKQYGLFYYLRKLINRRTFYVSIIAAVIFLYVLTLFIWQINIDGCVNVSEEEIIKLIESLGNGYGVFKGKIDCDSIENEIRDSFENILWVSVSIEGTGLFVQIKENTYLNDKMAINDGSANLVADSDGVVVSIMTRTGVAKVKAGDTVKEGDILISGVQEYLNDAKEVYKTEHFYADGDVIIEKKREYTWVFSRRIRVKKYSDFKTGYALYLFNNRMINYKPNVNTSKCDIRKEDNILVVGGSLYLPLKINKTFYKKYEYQDRVINDESLTLFAKMKYREFCDSLSVKGVDIIEKNAKINLNESGCEVMVHMIIREKTGKHVPITVAPIEEVIQEEEP